MPRLKTAARVITKAKPPLRRVPREPVTDHGTGLSEVERAAIRNAAREELLAEQDAERAARASVADVEQEGAEVEYEQPQRTKTPDRDPAARADEVRFTHSLDGRGKLHIDPRHIPRGMSLKWARETYLGAPDRDNLRDSMEDGWKAVLATQMPHYAAPLLPGEERQDTLIRRGGMILMMRPLDWTAAARQKLAQANAQELASLDRNRRSEESMDGKNFIPTTELPQGARYSHAGKIKDRFADA